MPTSCYWVQQNNNNNNKQLLHLSLADPQTCARAEQLNTALLSFGLCVNVLLKTEQKQGASEELRCFPPAGAGLPCGWPNSAATQYMGYGAWHGLCPLALSSCRDITLKDKFSSSAARLWSRKVQSNERASEMIFSWCNSAVPILIRKGFIIFPDIQLIFSVPASYLI